MFGNVVRELREDGVVVPMGGDTHAVGSVFNAHRGRVLNVAVERLLPDDVDSVEQFSETLLSWEIRVQHEVTLGCHAQLRTTGR